MNTAERLSEGTRRVVSAAMARHPFLEREEEAGLARAWRERGCLRSRERLVNAHLALAMGLVRRFSGYGANADDLFACACAGLMVAADKFDPGKGTRFNSFARWYAVQEMNDHVMRARSLLRGPQTGAARALFFNLGRIKEALGLSGPLDREGARAVAERLARDVPSMAESITPEAVLLSDGFLSSRTGSLDAPADGGAGGASWGEFLADGSEPADETLAAREEAETRRRLLRGAVEGVLNERERFIVIHRSLRDEPMSLAEIGQRFGVTRERVRQLETRALQKVAAEVQARVREGEAQARRRAEAHRAARGLSGAIPDSRPRNPANGA